MKARKVLFILAIAMTALTGCRKHIRPERQNPGGSGEGGGGHHTEQTVTVKENKSWLIEYTGRQILDGETVDAVSTTVPSNIIYLISVLSLADYTSYENDKLKFMENELNWVMGMDKAEQEKYIYTGPATIYLNPLVHGDWYAFIIALDSDSKLTGEYAATCFEVKEEAPTQEFLKWVGSWKVSGRTDRPARDVTYILSIESLEANYMYNVSGWETLEKVEAGWMQMDQESLITYYDDGDMYFTSQYIQTYEDEEYNDTVEEVFLGEIFYKGTHATPGIYIIEEEEKDLAVAKLSEDGKSASLEPAEVNALIGEGEEQEEYATVFYDMKYFGWSQKEMGWFVYNEAVAIFPFTMEKIAEVPADTKAPALKRGTYNRPLRGKVFVPKDQKKAVKARKL